MEINTHAGHHEDQPILPTFLTEPLHHDQSCNFQLPRAANMPVAPCTHSMQAAPTTIAHSNGHQERINLETGCDVWSIACHSRSNKATAYPSFWWCSSNCWLKRTWHRCGVVGVYQSFSATHAMIDTLVVSLHGSWTTWDPNVLSTRFLGLLHMTI